MTNRYRTKYFYTLLFSAAIDPPMVRVIRSGQPDNVAGSRYVLNCKVTLPTGVTVSDVPSVQWRRPSGGSATGNTLLAGVSGGSSFYLYHLIFDPLTLSEGGDYTCTATYSLGGQTSPIGTDTYSISVMSKCVIIDKK